MNRLLCAALTTVLVAFTGCSNRDDRPSTASDSTSPSTADAQTVFSRVSKSVVTIKAYTVHQYLRTSSGKTSGLTLEELEKAEPVSERYETPVSTGSGVVVSDNEVATNCHVIMPGHQSEIVTPDERTLATKSVELDLERDLCLLVVDDLDLPPVAMRDVDSLQVGEPAYSVGSPSGLSQSLAQGLISGIRKEGERVVIQTTAAISPGSSGGGLFDSTGNLVGITTFKVKDAEQLGFALPSNWIGEIHTRWAAHRAESTAAQEKYAKACANASVRREACAAAHDPAACITKATKSFPEDANAGPAWTIADRWSPSAWECAAMTYGDAHIYSTAVVSIDKAVDLRPLPSTLIQAGFLHMSLGSSLQQSDPAAGHAALERSLQYLDRATRADPRSDDAWAALARTHFVMRNTSQATQAANRALALNSNCRSALTTLKMIELGM